MLLCPTSTSLPFPTSMDFSGGGRGEAGRWLEIAGKLLAARDLVGCKRLAERAVGADPLLPGADELLAVADVLLASQRLLPSGRPDPLAVLQLPPDPDPAAPKRSFRRLAALLSSPRNPHPGADSALRIVQEAYSLLSDPSENSSPNPLPASGDASAAADSFWTSCPYCCHVYQYPRDLVGRALRCPSAGCRRAFVATEISAVPPVVPGTDMYYCAWGFFPVGFPNAADLSSNWKPFYPMFPCNSSSPQPVALGGSNVNGENIENNGGSSNANPPLSNVQPTTGSGGGGIGGGASRGRIKKTTARKKVGAGLKKNAPRSVESSIESSMLGPDAWGGSGAGEQMVDMRGININEEVKAPDGGDMMHIGGDDDMVGFDLDVDATDAILGNLQHLPFLREDENIRRML